MGLKPAECLKSAIGSWKRALMSFEPKEENFGNNSEQHIRGNCFEMSDGARFRCGMETLGIVDDEQKDKTYKTKNVRIIGCIPPSQAYLLMLPAPAFESPDKARVTVSVLWRADAGRIGQWPGMVARACFASQPVPKAMVFCSGTPYALKRHHEIFPRGGIRLQIRDIHGFPECRCMVNPIILDGCDRRKIDRALTNVRALAEYLRDKNVIHIRTWPCESGAE
jgi:hypothetical protein